MAINPIVFDCTPAMADVVSGAVPQPRERRKRENAFQWLTQTLAFARVIDHFGLGDQWPAIDHRPDLKPPVSLGLDAFPDIYSLAWHNPPKSGAVLLCVNSDGTRCAILDAWEEIVRLWDATRRPAAGRPRIDTQNTKTLYQRELRERRKSSTN